jgi:formyltetrahydrofolate synthetase
MEPCRLLRVCMWPVAGVPLAKEYKEENVDLVTAGCCNLVRHIENSRMFGVPVVVAINQFVTDTDAELEAVKKAALDAGALLQPGQ